MKRLGLVALLLLVACLSTQVFAETVYFLVGEVWDPPDPNEFYVLPLTDPCDIADARDLIEYGPEPEVRPALVVAAIDHWDPNNGINVNRNYHLQGIPAWSWYVTEFANFADFTTEILDGEPSWVESDVEWWIQNTGGLIGFWDFTVLAELGTDLEPWNCDLTVDGIIGPNDLAWFTSHWLDSGCCHRYYCEGADIDGSSEVDFKDFAIFANNWLWEE